ncbi:MAG TPA: asparagine--tRNA ligase [Bacteroidales bacterium]|jgi:asparaginyl-tRNA synthetase|nr:asparagine--tRNA ligase [Bacteroidales bacterium]HRS18142.1 asparagine--tRNA ligase [Bacteroidales bacterium]
MRRTEIKTILQKEEIGAEVVVKGWVRNYRGNNFVMFVALNDGSSLQNLQIVIDIEKFDAQLLKKITVGSSLSIQGTIAKSEGKGQSIEVLASSVEVLGTANADEYPLQPKKHSLEFLREIGHLRFRSNTFGAITRIRHQMIYAIHTFFHERGFYNIHTPIITGSDCEGAGEMFQVTTLDLKKLPFTKDGNIDFSEDFFGKQTNLTVSGQLEVEMACMAMSKVYTFGPTFRAENSNTSRHLAEFWMIEPEVAFADIYDDMDLAEEFLKYLISYALTNCKEDLEFLQERLLQEEKSKPEQERSMPLIEKLQFVLANDFQRLTYTEAIEILKESKPNKKGQFKYEVKGFGTDLQSEHERYLVEKHFKKPVILTGYPKEIKAFYMKQNPDGKTVAAMDVLFPQIGEIIGGSEREADYDTLYNRMVEMNIPTEELYWYLDSRRYGTVPHAGFGLGFERLMLFVTGMGNIRDVIPFPRYPKSADF